MCHTGIVTMLHVSQSSVFQLLKLGSEYRGGPSGNRNLVLVDDDVGSPRKSPSSSTSGTAGRNESSVASSDDRCDRGSKLRCMKSSAVAEVGVEAVRE